MTPPGPFTLALVGLVALVVVCAAVLVGMDKVAGDDFMLVVVGPIVGGVIGAVAGAKGFQSGSEATASPPPSA